ncbi:MAG: hypothetical protein AAB606_00130 [Patescibacteria group bacterium]
MSKPYDEVSKDGDPDVTFNLEPPASFLTISGNNIVTVANHFKA